MKKSFITLAFILCAAASQAQTTVTTTGGTTNQIPKFDSTGTAIVNSAMTEMNGKLGVGTTNPISALTLAGGGNPNPNTGPQLDYPGEKLSFFNNPSYELGGIRMVQPPGYYVDRGNMVFSVGIGGTQVLDAVTIQAPAGNVGIGTMVPQALLDIAGNVKISGSGANLTFPDGSTQSVAWNGIACGGDYAESVDVAGSRAKYEPGDVLVLTSEGSDGDVQKAQEAYSTAIVGIYSTKPGITGRRQSGDLKDSKTEVPMAMVGIVPTKVSAENGPIVRGDLLVTSSTSGYAMKGTDRSKMLGAVIGKAMGSLKNGTGMIDVVVTLQ